MNLAADEPGSAPTAGLVTPVDPADVLVLVDVASRVVPPTWGLDHVVAVNPLGGFEDLPFEEAAARATDLYGARCYFPPALLQARLDAGSMDSEHLEAAWREHTGAPAGAPTTVLDGSEAGDDGAFDPWTLRARPASTELRRRGTDAVADRVDALVAHWCAAALGPGRRPDEGIYEWWRALAPHDPELRRGARAGELQRLAATAAEAISQSLALRRVDADDAVAYLEAQLARLPGWAGVMARRVASGQRNDLIDLVAIRLTVEHLLVSGRPRPDRGAAAGSPPAGPSADPAAEVDAAERAAVWQAAAELAYADRLLGALSERPAPAPMTTTPDAQVVFCIDVRSEGLRRHLEATGPYETLGFAGFFGLPVTVQPADGGEAVASCPVIVDPRATVAERVVAGSLPAPADRDIAHRGFHTAEVGGTSGFALADSVGWALGGRTLAATLAPGAYARVTTWLGRLGRRPVRTRFDLDSSGLSLDDQVRLAHGALTAMGLTRGFAPVVVFCAHRSTNRNNPFRSSLDCGACGGNPGGPNARILAAICNRPEVRARLADLGVAIDPATRFVAAEHETTDDVVRFLDVDVDVDVDGLPTEQRARLERLASALERAGSASREERRRRFPASPLPSRRTPRSADPAQVVPDWGLARCAAIVIGPRSLTSGVDLDRRTFLHSYRPADDPDGLVLEAIMTGPVVVAHWISAQYYFSTVDPHRFGAGPKPLHNVVERVGVAVGAGADVRIGLPLESVWFDGRPVHDPLRLLVVVDAPRARVEAVIARNPVLRRLFDNGWARVAAREPDGSDGRDGTEGMGGFVLRDRTGRWSTPPGRRAGRPFAPLTTGRTA